jgi:hypothetical protein
MENSSKGAKSTPNGGIQNFSALAKRVIATPNNPIISLSKPPIRFKPKIVTPPNIAY